MDCDDNDFQSQNFQLVGDENNKFPPSLRPFALPKFDLDEHLQVHLRFDSLLQSEILLGIQDQENNWIEEFSPGSSAIEFSASAAESCSISRRNNVWSEATSSESVEMLLKSVGEDEMINKKTITTEADTHNGLTGMDDQMDHCLKQDDGCNSQMEDIMQAGAELPPDTYQRNLSNEHESGDQPQVEGMSQNMKDETSGAYTVAEQCTADERSIVVEQCTVDERSVGAEQCTADETLTSEINCIGKSSIVINDMLYESVSRECLDSATCNSSHDDPSASSVGNFVMDSERLNSHLLSEKTGEIRVKEKSAMLSDDAQIEKRSNTFGDGVNDQHFEGSEGKSHLCSDHLEPSIDSLMLMAEGRNSDGLLEAIAYQVKALSKDSEAGSTPTKNMHSLVRQKDKSRTMEKICKGEVVEGVERIETKCKSPEDPIPNESPLPVLSDDADIKSSSSIPASSVGSLGNEYAVMSVNSDISQSNNDDHVIMEKEDDASPSGEKSESKDMKLASTKESPEFHQSHPEDTSAVEEKKEMEPAFFSANSVDDDETGVKFSGVSTSSTMKSNLGTQMPSEPARFADPLSGDDLAPRRMVQNDSGVGLDSLDEVIKPQESQCSHDNIISEKKEAACSRVEAEVEISGVPSSPISKDNIEAQILGRTTSESDTGKCAPLSPTTGPQPTGVGQSPVESSVHIACPEEHRPLTENTITKGHALQLKGSVIDLDSAVKGKGDISGLLSQENMSTTSSISVQTANVGESQILPVDASTEESFSGNSEDKQKTDGVKLTPGGGCDGKNVNRQTATGEALSCHTDNSPAFILPRSTAEAHVSEDEGVRPSSFEPSCGSPTVISCSRHSQDELECQEVRKALAEKSSPVLEDAPRISSQEGMKTDKDKSTANVLQAAVASEDDRSFTFEVGSLANLSERDTGNKWNPFPNMQSFEAQISKENSQVPHLESQEVKLQDRSTKTPDEDKSRHLSNERRTTPKGKSAKERSSAKKSVPKEGKSTPLKSGGAVSKDMQLEETREYAYSESSSMKQSSSPIIQTSSLPDLNSSVSAAALFHQPFTDLQQVQLRAQIFVYGSLIQGMPPDEACMVSAFGETADGGRSVWEGVWRVSLEKFQNQKSPVGSCETPLHARSGVRVPDQVTLCSSFQSKSSSTSASRSSSKVAPSAILGSTASLPSPLWSVSTRNGSQSHVPSGTHFDFGQALSPLHSYQSPQMRQYASNSTPWLSQTPRTGPWGGSSQCSTVDATVQCSTVPVVETVQLTPVRDLSASGTSMQLVSPSALLPTSSTIAATASFVQIENQKKTGTPGNDKNESSVQKSRKRKKVATPQDPGMALPVSQPVTESANVSSVIMHSLPVSAGWPMSGNSPAKVASAALVSPTSHIPPTNYQIISSGNTEQRAIFVEETSSRVEQARLQAEDAAIHAASSIRYSQGIWSQLATQKKSGLVSESEEKLASLAVAAAAAASVAKAAAAAAKVASDAALQAKMMVDETLSSVNLGNPPRHSETALDVSKNLARLSPGSILKGKEQVLGSNSVISAAREATRRRVEAASAATKRAENLDAVVKAAELAAEAVSQAGIIIAMGDPLPFTLNELLETGPESYWKATASTSEKLNKTNNFHAEKHTEDSGGLGKPPEQPPNSKEVQKTANEETTIFTAQSRQLEETYQGNGLGNSLLNTPNGRREKDHLSSNLNKDGIRKGSIVEVASDEDGLRGVWFSAQVLDVKDNKAYVCYNDLLSDEGSGKLKEWISLEGEGNQAPRIRIAHPITVAKYEGTRKRRRDAVGNYIWAVGDRVDALIRDGWWEGIITEKNQGDETKLTVHFPAGGDSSVVRAWNLRPSLVWKDGQWMEWTRTRENMLQAYKGDTPEEKRQKLGRFEAKIGPEVIAKGIGKLSKEMPLEDSRKPEEPKPLMLSAKDKIFSIGKNAREESVTDALKGKRTGMQKEGSRVVFGVPRPGKKRKFMEVSKHYVSDKTEKASEGNDSIKFAKYLMPQAPRVWRNSSKVDPKGKPGGDSKPRGLKSGRSNIQTRNMVEKDNSSVIPTSTSNGLPSSKANSSSEEKNLEKKNSLEFSSFFSNPGVTEGLVIESSVQPGPGISVSKKKSTPAVEADPGVKGRAASAVDKSIRNEEKTSEKLGKTNVDTIEPRRSNRRIQPTSRLLEGLQSSLIISKMPNFSHDKVMKAQHRGSSSRGNTHG